MQIDIVKITIGTRISSNNPKEGREGQTEEQ